MLARPRISGPVRAHAGGPEDLEGLEDKAAYYGSIAVEAASACGVQASPRYPPDPGVMQEEAGKP